MTIGERRTLPRGGRTDSTRGNATGRSGWRLVIALGIGVFIGGFDQTFVVPVLSTILGDLRIPIDQFGQASWIINGYLLGYTVALPLMGRVADVYGPLRVFVIAVLIFMGGSVLVALAPSLWTLSLARAVTALGGGALVPVAMAITADVLPERQRPLGYSTVSILDDASSLVGPAWGTLIGVWIGWRGLFWMNIVLALPVLIAVIALARRMPPPNAGGKVDWTGGLLLAGALSLLTFALADASAEPRPLAQTLGFYAGAAVLFVVFWLWERRAHTPLIELSLIHDRRLLGANILFFLDGGALITALVNVPLMAETLWGMSGAQPGLMLMRMVLFMLVGGLAGGLLAPRIGYRVTALTGFALAGAGLIGMRLWALEPSEGARWAALAVAGFGFTLSDAPIYSTVLNRIATGHRAAAAALLQVMQTTGMIVGMALLASQGLGRFDERAAGLFAEDVFNVDPEQYRAVIHQTFDETFLVAALVLAVGAVLCLLLPSTREEEAEA